MKRTALAAVLIAIIALALASWYLLNNENNVNHESNRNSENNENNQNDMEGTNVRILNFSHVNTEPWQPTFNFETWVFSITIVNLAPVNVSGITLVVRLETEQTGLSWNVKHIDTLYPQEKQEVELRIAVGWNDVVYKKVATLVLGNVYLNTTMSEFLSLPVLDEQTLV